MHKENNGQCRGKNEKLCKVKRAGESNRTQVIDRTEYYNLNLNHTAIIINRKNWRITIKLHFGNLSIFFLKSQRTHMLGPPPSVRFCLLFKDPPSPPQGTYFLNDPFGNFQRENVFLPHFIYIGELLKIFLRHFNFAFWARNFVLQHFNFGVELKKYFSRNSALNYEIFMPRKALALK